MNPKQTLREEFLRRFENLWPESAASGGPPLFPERGRAAERLRRLQQYRKARTIAVMPDAVLLQARINALNDGKNIIAATPGLKQGLVRITPDNIAVARRNRDLRGHAMFKAGRPLRFPQAKVPRVDLLLAPVLAADEKGNVLGDGRGLTDLTYALLRVLGAMDKKALVAVVASDEQLVADLPQDSWDVPFDLLITPSRVIRSAVMHAAPDLSTLPPKLAALPVVQAVKGRQAGRK